MRGEGRHNDVHKGTIWIFIDFEKKNPQKIETAIGFDSRDQDSSKKFANSNERIQTKMQKTSIFGIFGEKGQFWTVFGQNGWNGMIFQKYAWNTFSAFMSPN